MALKGLYEVEYEGTIITADYCVSAATFEPLPKDKLQELVVGATVTLGDETDPDFVKFQAIMDRYASKQPELSGVRGWTYQAIYGLVQAMNLLDPADITAESVAGALNTRPSGLLPLGGGITWVCDGSAFPPAPGFCTNATLETHLDADGNFTTYEFVDVSKQLTDIAASFG